MDLQTLSASEIYSDEPSASLYSSLYAELVWFSSQSFPKYFPYMSALPVEVSSPVFNVLVSHGEPSKRTTLEEIVLLLLLDFPPADFFIPGDGSWYQLSVDEPSQMFHSELHAIHAT